MGQREGIGPVQVLKADGTPVILSVGEDFVANLPQPHRELKRHDWTRVLAGTGFFISGEPRLLEVTAWR